MRAFRLTLGSILIICSATVASLANPGGLAHVTPALATARNRLLVTSSHFVITVDRNQTKNADRVLVNSVAVDLTGIYDKLSGDFDGTQTDAIIEAAPDVHYGTVLTVVAALKNAGFNGVGLASRVRGTTFTRGGIVGFQKSLVGTTDTSHDSEQSKTILVLVNRSNSIWIGKRPTSVDTVYSDMARAVTSSRMSASQRRIPQIHLIADEESKWQTIILILDAARQAGDDDVSFTVDSL